MTMRALLLLALLSGCAGDPFTAAPDLAPGDLGASAHMGDLPGDAGELLEDAAGDAREDLVDAQARSDAREDLVDAQARSDARDLVDAPSGVGDASLPGADAGGGRESCSSSSSCPPCAIGVPCCSSAHLCGCMLGGLCR